MNDTQATAVLGNFQINLPAPNGASISISGYIYDAESKESLDARMDLCREALRRQQEILERPVLEEKLKGLVQMAEQIEKAYLDLLEQKKRKTLPSQQEQHLKNYPLQLKQIRAEIEQAHTKLGIAPQAAQEAA